MSLQLLIPPLVGGCIGYITNDIAIRMLFRPRKALYIGKWRVPFTPGLIPKEKDRIAATLGAAIQTHLLNGDILAESLASPEMLETIRQRLTAFVDGQRDNSMTVEEVLLQYTSPENLERTTEGVKKNVATVLHNKLVELEFGEDISTLALEGIRTRMQASRWAFASKVMDDRMIGSMSQRTGEMINTAVVEHSQEMLEEIIGREADKLLEYRICDVIERYDEKLPELIETLLKAYTGIISSCLSRVVNAIRLDKIIEERIAALDAAELEQLIFSIMKKELRAIVYLGALLGFVMGFINVFIGGFGAF